MTDRLGSLPPEIQDSIFSRLTFHERLRCSTVCSSWRSLILNWPGMWQRLSTLDGHNIIPDLISYKEYVQGPDVRYLCVSDYDRRKSLFLAKVAAFLSERGCNSIEHIEFSVNWVISTTFLDIAAICSNSLTWVDLNIVRYVPHPITLDQILLRCPNLRKLYLVSLPWQKLQEPSPSIDFQHQNLIDLALYVHSQPAIMPRVGDAEYIFDLSTYLKSMPKLQRLCLAHASMDGGPSLSLLSLLRRYCPFISSLYISRSIEGILHAKSTEWKMQQTSIGLVELGLMYLSEGSPKMRILRHIVNESHERLKVLELRRLSLFSQDTFEFMSTLVFPSLNRLVISGRSGMTLRSLCNFLARSVPNLVSLKLHVFDCPEVDEILQVIASNIERLEHLELADAYPSITSSQLIRFFNAMAGGPLQTIILRNVQNLTAQVLSTVVPKYLDISEIMIIAPDNSLAQELATFLNSWPSGRRISKLYIHIYEMKSKADDLSDQDYIMQFLTAMDKAARQWTFETKFPEHWTTLSIEPNNKWQYNRRRGTVNHTIYREYIRRRKMYNCVL